MKNLGGRPLKITKTYGNKLSIGLADLFKNGESVAEVCLELDICKESFYKLCKMSPKFSNAYKKGLGYSEAWWTKLGRAGAAGKVAIQPATWCFNMKNRFNWTDKGRTTVTIENNNSNTEQDAKDLTEEEATNIYLGTMKGTV